MDVGDGLPSTALGRLMRSFIEWLGLLPISYVLCHDTSYVHLPGGVQHSSTERYRYRTCSNLRSKLLIDDTRTSLPSALEPEEADLEICWAALRQKRVTHTSQHSHIGFEGKRSRNDKAPSF
jgi:hypothetical protein